MPLHRRLHTLDADGETSADNTPIVIDVQNSYIRIVFDDGPDLYIESLGGTDHRVLFHPNEGDPDYVVERLAGEIRIVEP